MRSCCWGLEPRCQQKTSGKSPPKTSELTSLLAYKFVSPDYAEASLVQVADYAINESSLFQVQDFLREVFLPFQPSDTTL